MPFLSFIATREYISEIAESNDEWAQWVINDFFEQRRPFAPLIPHHRPSIEEHLSSLEKFVEAQD